MKNAPLANDYNVFAQAHGHDDWYGWVRSYVKAEHPQLRTVAAVERAIARIQMNQSLSSTLGRIVSPSIADTLH